ncbi:hypothetical protein GCM10010218_31550 [Streptomyces mashuensis]|uniref:DUF4913 domain-containing protein n=1 Tax=Streptomyces mashuensis TaxID=33904 RepID=A0A919EDS5_9ACTN|nr:DUF4913 domain-containing protein [Streptomyces mashuensis]GHF47816.1 hypothetical protein GCM10010218_31550 [Streptomyces mashuensis]
MNEPGTDAGQAGAPFILYLEGEDQRAAMEGLAYWVSELLLPVYGREVTSRAPWCPQWWEHLEAVAQLHGLWLAWQELTGTNGGPTGPAMWHRDFLTPVMQTLRDPDGPFAGCRAGGHRAKDVPVAEPYPA